MHFIGHAQFSGLSSCAFLALLVLVTGCERDIEARCAAEPVKACCLLSLAQAESSVGSRLSRSRTWETETESGCLYTGGGEEFAEIVMFKNLEGWPGLEPLSRWEDVSIAGEVTAIFWQPGNEVGGEFGLAKPGGAVFAWHSEVPFRIRSNPLGAGYPDWKRSRDVVRRVLRNLSLHSSQDPQGPD